MQKDDMQKNIYDLRSDSHFEGLSLVDGAFAGH